LKIQDGAWTPYWKIGKGSRLLSDLHDFICAGAEHHLDIAEEYQLEKCLIIKLSNKRCMVAVGMLYYLLVTSSWEQDFGAEFG